MIFASRYKFYQYFGYKMWDTKCEIRPWHMHLLYWNTTTGLLCVKKCLFLFILLDSAFAHSIVFVRGMQYFFLSKHASVAFVIFGKLLYYVVFWCTFLLFRVWFLPQKNARKRRYLFDLYFSFHQGANQIWKIYKQCRTYKLYFCC